LVKLYGRKSGSEQAIYWSDPFYQRNCFVVESQLIYIIRDNVMKNNYLLSFLLLFPFYLGCTGLSLADRGLSGLQGPSSANRYALIIGNSQYTHLPRLKNPKNDANDFLIKLKSLGFNATLLLNASQQKMESAISKFGQHLRLGGVGLFYYAGHGIQSKGRNYLIPANAKLKTANELRYKAVDMGYILGEMGDANNGLNIVIIDACRDNPLASQFRSAKRGLTRVEYPRGTLIFYATAEGNTAEDGYGRNSTFTKHLLNEIATPNIPVFMTFQNVIQKVDRETRHTQTPWIESSFVGDFYFSTNIKASNSISRVSRGEDKDKFKEEIRKRADLQKEKDRLEQALATEKQRSRQIEEKLQKNSELKLAKQKKQHSPKMIKNLPSKDLIPPIVEHKPSVHIENRPVKITARITDNVGVKNALLFYRISRDESYERMSMDQVSSGMYRVIIPKDIATPPSIEYYIRAEDLAGNTLSHGQSITPLIAEIGKKQIKSSAATLNAEDDEEY
jgi:hypothetical protein